MKYQDIRPQLKTGDVLLFSGKSEISEGIKFFTLSKWSHVGIVYKLESELDPKGSIFSWESTTLCDICDADTGKLTQGVQRVELSERLERCFAAGYDISVRQLSEPLSKEMIRRLNDFRHEVSGRPYEKNKIDLIKAVWDGPFGKNKGDLSSLFCSELIAEAFQRVGLLGHTKPSDEYTPKDFSTERRLQLELGYSLGNEINLQSL